MNSRSLSVVVLAILAVLALPVFFKPWNIPINLPWFGPPAETPVETPRFTNEAEAQREAVRLFPALAVAGSEFNRAFLTRHQQFQQYHPVFLRDPNWPVLLAREVDSSLTVASSRELPLPPSGEARDYSGEARRAPLAITCSPGFNYLLRLTYSKIDASVMTVVVRGGDTAKVNAPMGTYILKYAMGDKWYGYGALFGPTTRFNRTDAYVTLRENGAQIEGCSVTLDTVLNGKNRTETVKNSVLMPSQ